MPSMTHVTYIWKINLYVYYKKLKFKEMQTMTMGENIIKDQQKGRNKNFGGNFSYKNAKREFFGVYCHENWIKIILKINCEVVHWVLMV